MKYPRDFLQFLLHTIADINGECGTAKHFKLLNKEWNRTGYHSELKFSPPQRVPYMLW